MANATKLPIVMQALPRWDGKYASTSLNIAKELSKTRWVFYVDHPFTAKDAWFGSDRRDVAFRKPIWKKDASISYAPFDEYPRLVVISTEPTPIINFLPESFVYNWAERYANWQVWQTINRVLEQYLVTSFIYINSFDPTFSRVNTHLEMALKVYHCVDNIAGERYIARHGVRREKEFAQNADVVISTSPALAQKFNTTTTRSVCVPNAADFNLFNKPSLSEPEEFNRIGHPRILYMGNIGLRLDYNNLEWLAKTYPDLQLVFVGPKDAREFKGEGLEKCPNVWFLGAKPYERLNDYVCAADVCLIPFEPNDLTKYIYPLKINEYLATGKPVVSSRFADLSDFESVIYSYSSKEELYNAIKCALEEDNPQKASERKQVASQNTWEERGKQFNRVLEEALLAKQCHEESAPESNIMEGAME